MIEVPRRIKSRQMGHAGEVSQAGVGHGVAAEEVQLLHVLALQRRQAGIGDKAVFDGQDLQLLPCRPGPSCLHRSPRRCEA